MPCPPQVPISVIPPVSAGVGPLVWQNGNQITRLNIPVNQSFLVYDGSKTTWGDGSAQAPVYLPNLQQVTSSSVAFVILKTTQGQLVCVPASVGATNSGGTGYRQLIVPN
jgi:hypothetical protein